MSNFIFKHPEPERPKTRIWPVFMPFMGCPSRCVYCSQNRQTGTGAKTLSEIYQDIKIQIPSFFAEKEREPMELAFFGGTFTALPYDWQMRFIRLAAKFKENGFITKVRFSTRPDYINTTQLLELKNIGLDMVELGIQSFSAQTLKRSARNYSPETAVTACEKVHYTGLSLTIQLLPGLPGSEAGDFQQDISRTLELKPSAVRIYPCLTVRGTALEKLYKAGKYKPWPLEYTEDELAMALIRLWAQKIHVIRLGVAPESGMQENIIAGPSHPALGQTARSKALYIHLCSKMSLLGAKPMKLTIPNKYSGEFWGHKGSLKPLYKMIGITPDMVQFDNGNFFRMLSNILL
ncbi:radical SAM protein [Maridesulfovibrio zosterae]|uniref:radical SAM protein n=1 Tax=Maridesulfovibrio zosterae TaxID=82171 RepID=UPI000414F7E1|nr:radical SAM protein [Maridesulfovibrio zosterae]